MPATREHDREGEGGETRCLCDQLPLGHGWCCVPVHPHGAPPPRSSCMMSPASSASSHGKSSSSTSTSSSCSSPLPCPMWKARSGSDPPMRCPPPMCRSEGPSSKLYTAPPTSRSASTAASSLPPPARSDDKKTVHRAHKRSPSPEATRHTHSPPSPPSRCWPSPTDLLQDLCRALLGYTLSTPYSPSNPPHTRHTCSKPRILAHTCQNHRAQSTWSRVQAVIGRMIQARPTVPIIPAHMG
jgi:hypothetical protein